RRQGRGWQAGQGRGRQPHQEPEDEGGGHHAQPGRAREPHRRHAQGEVRGHGQGRRPARAGGHERPPGRTHQEEGQEGRQGQEEVQGVQVLDGDDDDHHRFDDDVRSSTRKKMMMEMMTRKCGELDQSHCCKQVPFFCSLHPRAPPYVLTMNPPFI
ncbi:uncharacterized protein ACA1_029410, partial [Acanthamoeba castellanii str. Neff]